VADYNGHWGVREICDICPAAQQRRCAQRLPADALDTAILYALADFYTSHTDLIADAVTRAQQRYRDGHADRRAEHAALLARSRRNRQRSTATSPRSRTAP
jgi:hypothetical protein